MGSRFLSTVASDLPRWSTIVLGLACALATQVSAQLLPDLRIEAFSVFSSLRDPDGQGRLAVSFRVVNAGRKTATPTLTRVTFDGNVLDLGTPALDPGGAVYMSRNLATTAAQVQIEVRADATGVIAEADETNNVVQYTAVVGGQIDRWLSIGPSKIQQSGGPLGVGRVTMIAVDPRSPFVVYAGARGSGLWKTAGLTTRWFPITDSLPSIQIDALALDPTKPDRVLIATPAGVFESLNGGAVWRQLHGFDLKAIGSDGGALLVAKAPNPPLHLSTANGVQVSTNGGQTWSTVLGGAPATSLQFSTSDATHLFAALSKPSPSVFEAKDRGLVPASWHKLRGCPEGPLPDFPPSSNMWIAESNGTQWISFRAGAADNKAFGLLRSTTGTCTIDGFTEHRWVEVPLTGPASDFANNFSYLFAHPNAPGLVFKGGIKLSRSEDFGSHFEKVDDSRIHDDHHAIAVAPSAHTVMFFGSDGGIYRSPDNGKTVNFLGEGLNNTELLTIDTDGTPPLTVIAGSQDNGTSIFDGSSPVWNWVEGTGDSSIVAIDRNDPSSILEIGQSMAQITRRHPGGDSQGLADGGPRDCCSYSESGAVFDSLVSTGKSPSIGLTCHGIWSGPPWKEVQPTTGQPLPPPPDQCDTNNSGDFTRLKLSKGNLGIWVGVTNTGRVFFGIFNQPPPAEVFHTASPESPSAIAFLNQAQFYVATNAGTSGFIHRFQCFVGCNHEIAWPVATSPAGMVTAVTVDPRAPTETLVAAVRGQGIFRGSRDSAGTWTWKSYNNGMPVDANVLDLETRPNGTIVAATYGRGAFLIASAPPGPPVETARGIVTSFDEDTLDNPLPHKAPKTVLTITLSSMPEWFFTEVLPGPASPAILKDSFDNHRTVTITFVKTGPTTGRLTGVKKG